MMFRLATHGFNNVVQIAETARGAAARSGVPDGVDDLFAEGATAAIRGPREARERLLPMKSRGGFRSSTRQRLIQLDFDDRLRSRTMDVSLSECA